MKKFYTTQSMETMLGSHLLPTVLGLAWAPARLATGARLGCGQPPPLHLGCPPQYRHCLLDCLHQTQVRGKWHTAPVHVVLFYLQTIKCDKYKLPSHCSQLCRTDGGFSENAVGEHICSACLHQKGEHSPCLNWLWLKWLLKWFLLCLWDLFCVCWQVYLILAAQLAVTFSVVAVFTFV